MESCIIAIPIYKPISLLSQFEMASLKQVRNVCKYRTIALICPRSLEVEDYMRLLGGGESKIVRFSDENFESVITYNSLCQKPELYEAFNADYILLYQLDAWIFEDNIDYFVEKGYDYIGSPHQDYINDGLVVGNGGFSLRKVSTFINVCRETDFSKCRQTWEDIVFTNDCADKLNIADLDTAYEFGWQQFPEKHMVRLQKLPMGVHSPQKYSNWEFWKKYIHI